VYVSRPDGRDRQTLVDYSLNLPNPPTDFHWTGADTLEYTVYLYDDPRYPDDVTIAVQRIRPGVEPTATPERQVAFDLRVNELPASFISSIQPPDGSIAAVRTTFNTGSGTGYKYYLYDLKTGEAEFFARTEQELQFEWHPLGDRLFYRYPDTDDWYVYEVASKEHRIFGAIPNGLWSPDGHYKVDWYYPPSDDVQRRVEAKQPIPKITIWDSQTGLTRRYCIPQTELDSLGGDLLWSPDSRYIAFRTYLPNEAGLEVNAPRLLVLDTETGAVVDLGFDVEMPVAWVEGGE
jgi:hypothetical protein